MIFMKETPNHVLALKENPFHDQNLIVGTSQLIRVLMDKLIVQYQRKCFCGQKHLALLEEVFLCSKTPKEEFSCTKTPKHLLRRTSSRRTQEEEEISRGGGDFMAHK